MLVGLFARHWSALVGWSQVSAVLVDEAFICGEIQRWLPCVLLKADWADRRAGFPHWDSVLPEIGFLRVRCSEQFVFFAKKRYGSVEHSSIHSVWNVLCRTKRTNTLTLLSDWLERNHLVTTRIGSKWSCLVHTRCSLLISRCDNSNWQAVSSRFFYSIGRSGSRELSLMRTNRYLILPSVLRRRLKASIYVNKLSLRRAGGVEICIVWSIERPISPCIWSNRYALALQAVQLWPNPWRKRESNLRTVRLVLTLMNNPLNGAIMSFSVWLRRPDKGQVK